MFGRKVASALLTTRSFELPIWQSGICMPVFNFPFLPPPVKRKHRAQVQRRASLNQRTLSFVFPFLFNAFSHVLSIRIVDGHTQITRRNQNKATEKRTIQHDESSRFFVLEDNGWWWDTSASPISPTVTSATRHAQSRFQHVSEPLFLVIG